MRLLVARDAVHARVRRVLAEQRPDRTMVGVFAVFETEDPAAPLLGVVTPHDLATNPGHIFADILPRKSLASVPENLGLEATLARMDEAQASALPVVDGQGSFVGAVTRESLWACLLLQDRALAAEVATLRTKLEIADRMVAIGTLAAGVAHEINNPLAYILLNLGSLREYLGGVLSPSDLTGAITMLDDIGTGFERVRRIVGDLRVLARPSTAPGESADVWKAVEFARALCRGEIRHRARLVEDLRPVPRVVGDEGQLGQVLINLLLNAAQAIPDGDADHNEIRIATHTDDAGWAVIEVSDSGSGMSEEVRVHVFDPFFTTKAQGLGLGLGLSICHGIVTGLGGRIEVASTPGRGSSFRIVLAPSLASGPPAAPPRSIPPPDSAPVGRFLVIDDETSITSAVARQLGRSQCVVCNSAREALDILAGGARFDAVLCDLTMPVMSGAEFFAALRETVPDQAARFIVMTGGARSERAQAFVSSLEHPPLMKPFTREELFATVRRIMRVGPTP